jgi:hypothetical protein
VYSERDRDGRGSETERDVVVVVRLEHEEGVERRLIAIDGIDREVPHIPAVERAVRGQLRDHDAVQLAVRERDLRGTVSVSGKQTPSRERADLDVARRGLEVLPGAEAERDELGVAFVALAAVLRERGLVAGAVRSTGSLAHQLCEVGARRGVQDLWLPNLARRRGRGRARARARRRRCGRGGHRAGRGREDLVGIAARALPTIRVSIMVEGM